MEYVNSGLLGFIGAVSIANAYVWYRIWLRQHRADRRAREEQDRKSWSRIQGALKRAAEHPIEEPQYASSNSYERPTNLPF